MEKFRRSVRLSEPMQLEAERLRFQLARLRKERAKESGTLNAVRAGFNQRIASPIYRGTNMTPYESAELDRLIEQQRERAAFPLDFDGECRCAECVRMDASLRQISFGFGERS